MSKYGRFGITREAGPRQAHPSLLPLRHRMPTEQWWLKFRPILKMLAKYQISFCEYVPGEIEHVTRRSISMDYGF